ncbi:adenylate/guanylate cyclase domain-containing protein [Geminocystis sp. CENA526]|uniref:adenylate/guanylate cyclase domain-containing protein n=1 Tax=Geminocystis sp. CENA526 TaxID=1355871 RepID=UPI003D6DDBC9
MSQDGSIPPPATFVIELGKEITNSGQDSVIELYSDYPYPWRENRTVNKFGEEALVYLRENKGEKKFFRIEDKNNRPFWKYAQSVDMSSSCVVCHNQHPQSPKKDWNIGDVRGVLIISNPLDKIAEKTKQSLQTASIMLGSFSILGISAVGLVFNRVRQTTRVLESQVRERTADLAEANEDLEMRNSLIRQIFGRYLSDEIVTNLLESPQSLSLGGERRKITILTSDLRGFTAISEILSAEEVISILNIYLENMADIISKYHGTINEIMGDGLLVLFGAPTEREDDSIRAIACALEMQLAMTPINNKLKKLGFPELGMGIGINTGLVVLGNIGSQKRTKYGIVGREVNLTFRIESYTLGNEILISESTFQEVNENVLVREEKQVQPKGIKEPITIYNIEGITGQYNLYLPIEQDLFVPLESSIEIEYFIVKEKQLEENIFKGKIIELSKQGAKIEVISTTQNNFLTISTNIKINLLKENASIKINEDIYGKVTQILPNNKIFYVSFTVKTPTLQKIIDEVC